jgi:hypothetical protein
MLGFIDFRSSDFVAQLIDNAPPGPPAASLAKTIRGHFNTRLVPPTG